MAVGLNQEPGEPLGRAVRDLFIKNKVGFREAIEAVLEAYGFADWVTIPRAVDGGKKAFWAAGGGESAIGDRERAMILIGEMEDLKDSIIQYWRKREA